MPMKAMRPLSPRCTSPTAAVGHLTSFNLDQREKPQELVTILKAQAQAPPPLLLLLREQRFVPLNRGGIAGGAVPRRTEPETPKPHEDLTANPGRFGRIH